MIANPILNQFGFTLLYEGHKIVHGGFHNIAIMVIFGVIMAFLLHPLGIKFIEAFVYSVIGFGAHLFEDALVYRVGYRFLWPFSSKVMGLGILTQIQSEEYYIRNFFGIANTGVLIIGLMLLGAAGHWSEHVLKGEPGYDGICRTACTQNFLIDIFSIHYQSILYLASCSGRGPRPPGQCPPSPSRRGDRSGGTDQGDPAGPSFR